MPEKKKKPFSQFFTVFDQNFPVDNSRGGSTKLTNRRTQDKRTIGCQIQDDQFSGGGTKGIIISQKVHAFNSFCHGPRRRLHKQTRTNMSAIVYNCNSTKSSDSRQEQTCCQNLATVYISNSQYLGFLNHVSYSPCLYRSVCLE